MCGFTKPHPSSTTAAIHQAVNILEGVLSIPLRSIKWSLRTSQNKPLLTHISMRAGTRVGLHRVALKPSHMKRCSGSLAIREMPVEITTTFYLIQLEYYLQRIKNNRFWQVTWGEGALMHCRHQCKLTTMERFLGNGSTPLLGIYANQTKSACKRVSLYVHLYLFTIAMI